VILPQPLMRDLTTIRTRLRSVSHVVLALDFDGTLAPIAPTPDLAALPRETSDVLASMADLDRVSIAVVSGRAVSDLKSKVTFPAVLVGNHGLEIEGPGFSFVHRRASALRPAVAQVCWDLRQIFEHLPGVRVECKVLSATVHHRGMPPELGIWVHEAAELAIRPYRRDLCTMPALAALEIRPRVAWNKGSAVRHLLARAGASRALVICAGDDRTDEDLFGAVPDALSIKVGTQGATRARYLVPHPAALLHFLRLVDAEFTRRPPTARRAGVSGVPVP
jgi:trehalose 6-phosphate phosphatase